MPRIWVTTHVGEIRAQQPTGNGEHDYALLLIDGPADGDTLSPASFPYVKPDVREAVGFTGDEVFVVAYPAEFGTGIPGALFSGTSQATIAQLLTFATKTVDLLSVQNVAEAQEGSSGGAIVNAGDRLVGIITTTSHGADHGLRAITLSYINRDMQALAGLDLNTILDKNPVTRADDFAQNEAPRLIKKYMEVLSL